MSWAESINFTPRACFPNTGRAFFFERRERVLNGILRDIWSPIIIFKWEETCKTVYYLPFFDHGVAIYTHPSPIARIIMFSLSVWIFGEFLFSFSFIYQQYLMLYNMLSIQTYHASIIHQYTVYWNFWYFVILITIFYGA